MLPNIDDTNHIYNFKFSPSHILKRKKKKKAGKINYILIQYIHTIIPIHNQYEKLTRPFKFFIFVLSFQKKDYVTPLVHQVLNSHM